MATRISREQMERNVRDYYAHVDAQRIDHALALFSPRINYDRAGKQITGISALRTFYHSQRDLQGRHKIDSLVVEKNHVLVRGQFEGVRPSTNQSVSLTFTDSFNFNPVGLISRRITTASHPI